MPILPCYLIVSTKRQNMKHITTYIFASPEQLPVDACRGSKSASVFAYI